jgi:hypothetical protein
MGRMLASQKREYLYTRHRIIHASSHSPLAYHLLRLLRCSYALLELLACGGIGSLRDHRMMAADASRRIARLRIELVISTGGGVVL